MKECVGGVLGVVFSYCSIMCLVWEGLGVFLEFSVIGGSGGGGVLEFY